MEICKPIDTLIEKGGVLSLNMCPKIANKKEKDGLNFLSWCHWQLNVHPMIDILTFVVKLINFN